MEQSGSSIKQIELATNLSNLANGSEPLEVDSEKAFGSISFGLGCSIIVINIVSLAFLIRHKGHVSGKGFLQQLFLLCFTDILTGVAISVFYLGSLLFSEHSAMQYIFCLTGIFLFPISTTLSYGNCCLISIFRYRAVRTLHQQVTNWDRRTLAGMILVNTFAAILTVAVSVLVVYLRFGFDLQTFCTMINKTGQNEYKTSYIIGTIMLWLFLLVCTNVVTFLSIKEIGKVIEVQSSSGSTEIASSIAETNRNATQTCIMIVAVLNLTSLPSLIFLFYQASTKAVVSATITEILSRLLCTNSLINPFIYSLRMNDYRRAVWEDFRAVLARLRCNSA